MLTSLFHSLPDIAIPFIYAGSLWFVWRTWMFTIKPWIFPSLPRDLPYWTPCHTVSFLRDYTGLVEDGINALGRTYEPFSIQLLGKALYVCPSPQDAAPVFDDTHNFNFDNHITELLTSFGISKKALRHAWHCPQPGDRFYIPDNPINPKQKSFIHCVEDIYKTQLFTASLVNEWSSTFLQSASESLSDVVGFQFAKDTAGATPFANTTDHLVDNYSLYALVSFFSVEATSKAMFGTHLEEINPSVIDIMLKFNEHAWMLIFRRPTLTRLPVEEPQRQLMDIMRQFVQLPAQQRPGCSWAITNIMHGMDLVDIDIESRAAMMLMIFWAAISNEHNSCFWLLAYLIHDDSLLGIVKSETEAAWRDGQLDIKFLMANSPNLEAIFNEVMRLSNTAAAVRVATHKTTVGGKVLPKGSLVVVPFRQLHTNKDAWGANACEFDPTRFLKRKALSRHIAFRPFGGGANLCPGQALARQEVFGFIATLLHRFDVRLATTDASGQEMKQRFPQLNSKAPSFGVNGPVQGQDVLVTITTI